jgi:hypothetical protein
MSANYPKPEDQIMQWITSKWITKPIHVAVELAIPDLLRDGPLSVDRLAEKTDTDAPTLYRLLRALSAVGIFVERDGRIFGNTPFSKCLLSDAMAPLARMFLSDWHDKAWSALEYSIKTGKSGFDHAFGKPSFEWIEQNPGARKVLDRGQGFKAVGWSNAIMNGYDFSGIGSICDIGGGQGSFLIPILVTYPDLTGIVADMPGTVPAAEKSIAEAGLGDRCSAISYDFMKGAPPACDGYFMVNVLHDWDDDICHQILGNVSRSMGSDSKLWIVEYLLEPGPGFSVAKLLDIEMLVMGGGRERTFDEYESLVGSAGLAVNKAVATDIGVVMVECKLLDKS